MKCKIILLFTFFSLSLFACNNNISYKDKYSKLLEQNYKSDIEFIFDPLNLLNSHPEATKNISNEASIRNYFHKYKVNELNLQNGAKMKCYTPSKIKKVQDDKYKNLDANPNKIENISSDLAKIFLRDSSNICYNSNFREWLYKLCPFRSANQVLSYKKNDELSGEEYTESWSLGYANADIKLKNEFNATQIYLNETNDTSVNLEKNPFVNVEDRVAKIYNTDLSTLKKYELALEVEYDIEALIQLNKDKPILISKYIKSLEDYLIQHPDAKKIPIQRKILKLINKHLVILDSSFPISKATSNFSIVTIKQRVSTEINTSYNLNVYGEYIYCHRCEFLTYYSTGDSFFIKNMLYTDSLRFTFKQAAYKSRSIVQILDNHLLKVDKKYPRDYQGAVLRQNYFVFDSRGKDIKWSNGKGAVNVKGSLVIGRNTQFKKQLIKGDIIVFYNTNKVQESFNIANSNPKLKTEDNNNDCVVDKVISSSLLLTKSPCKKPFAFKGTYFIGKPFYKYNSGINNTLQLQLEAQAQDQSQKEREKILSPIDFYTIENLNIFKTANQFYDSKFLIHPGFLIRNEQSTVFRMKLEKGVGNINSVVKILFGTDLSFYKNKNSKINIDNDYELLINSESGAMIKKIKENSPQGYTNIEFYDTEIRSFFQEQLLMDIIFHENSIYLSTVDDDKESSIKIKFTLPIDTKVKYLYFDTQQSDNVYIKNIRKMNFIEQKYLFNVWVFEKRLLLTKDAVYVEEMNNGDFCPHNKSYRKSVIEYRCDETGNFDVSIMDVKEQSMCEYRYYVKSKHLCNPVEISLNKIEKSIAKTKCIVANDNYNDNEEVYFRNVTI